MATVFLGADHAGFDIKNIVREHLEAHGDATDDLGAHTLNPHDDYPMYAAAVAQAVREHHGAFGILACGNAEGICMAANKFDGIRAGIGYSIEAARTMRNDDNANILCIPGRVHTQDNPLAIVDAFLSTPFSGEARHLRRLGLLHDIEVDE